MAFTPMVSALALMGLLAQAPRDGMQAEYWASGIKQGVGTAHGYSSSKVWFTLAQGVLTEAYWPTIDEPQIRDSQFLVVDPSQKGADLFWEERTQGMGDVSWLESGVPAFKVTTRDALGRFEIEKWIWTEQSRDVIRMRVRFHAHKPGLKLFVLHNPTVGASPMTNSGSVSGAGLFAWDKASAQAWMTTLPIGRASASFSGP